MISFILGKLIDKTIGFRITKREENDGIDRHEHSENGYDLSPVYYSSLGGSASVRRTLYLEPDDLPEDLRKEVSA